MSSAESRSRLHPVGLFPPLRLHRALAGGPPTRAVRRQALPLPPGSFARNDVGFVDPTGVDHDALGVALKKALYNYMHGLGLEEDVRSWFNGKVPRPTVPRGRIARALAAGGGSPRGG
jgi:hypothetical protein